MQPLPSRASSRQGFTLIELLIVITIIGILAVALVPRITQGPARARDVDRKADLQNIASALELYFSDNGHYPDDGTIPDSDCVGTGSSWLDTEISQYLDGGTVPTDPGGGSPLGCISGYYYQVMPANEIVSTASSYILVADVEIDTATTDGHFCNITSDSAWIDLPDTKTDLQDSSHDCSSVTTPNAFYTITR